MTAKNEVHLAPSDPVTRLNHNIYRTAPTLAGYVQWCYMAAGEILKPNRQFKTFYGATMKGSITDMVLKRICFFGFFEPALTRFMADTVAEGQTVVDVGANHGYFTMLMSRLVGDKGLVIAIEAFPSTYKSLTENLETNGSANVDARNVAIADHKGEIRIAAPAARNSGTATIVFQSAETALSVPCDTLMGALGDAASQVSFIKIDIEGAERAPLEEIIAHKEVFARPLNVVVEISADNRDLPAKFADAGFDVLRLPNSYAWAYYLNSGGDLSPYSEFERRSDRDDYIFRLQRTASSV